MALHLEWLTEFCQNPQYANFTKRLRDADGIPIGMANENPILDSRMYEVEYQDGTKASLVVNYIAENLFLQVDQEGKHVLLDELIDYRVNGREVKLQDAFITTSTGTRRRRETTIGWELLVQWRDGSTNWVSLKDLKESYPEQTAEYAVCDKDCHGTCLRLVGSIYVEKEKLNHIKSKVKILVQNPQVWDSDTQVSRGGQVPRPGKW